MSKIWLSRLAQIQTTIPGVVYYGKDTYGVNLYQRV